jgi:hypothetical protein
MLSALNPSCQGHGSLKDLDRLLIFSLGTGFFPFRIQIENLKGRQTNLFFPFKIRKPCQRQGFLIRTRTFLHAAEIPVQEPQLGQAEDLLSPILEFLGQLYGLFKLPCGRLKIPSLD